MQTRFSALCAHISPIDPALRQQAQAHLDNLTKPQGSLGRLETAAVQLFSIQHGSAPALSPDPAIMFTVAGDHGVAEEGVSPFPQAVTRQMVLNFLQGGAGINVLCKSSGMDLKVVDAGCAGGPFAPHPLLLDRRLGDGTANFTHGPAMSREACLQALLHGAQLAADAAEAGYRCVGAGEMGIANTTPATALYCACLGLEPENIVGPGAGANQEMMRRKTRVVRAALSVNAPLLRDGDAVDRLAALGGFEIAVMAGVMLGGARHGMAVLVDGFISTSAFVAARSLCPALDDYCFLTHASAEPGYAPVVAALGKTPPLLHLGLRLGEGTGAALALPLLRAAAAIYNDMATFAQAGVTGTPCNP